MNVRYVKIQVRDIQPRDRIRRRQNSRVGNVYSVRQDSYHRDMIKVSLACGPTDEIFRMNPEAWVWLELPRA